MSKIIYLAFILILLAACSENENKEEAGIIKKVSLEDFPMREWISGELILQEDYNINRKIYVIDSLLLLETKGGDFHFNVYHKHTRDYLGPIGVRGEAPGEWRIVYFTGQFEVSESGIGMWVSEYHKGFLSKLNITKTLDSGSAYPVIDRTFDIDGTLFPFLYMTYISDEKLISKSWINEEGFTRIKSLNPKTGEVKKSKLFPKIKNVERLPVEVLNSLYTSGLYKHPSKNLILQAMSNFDRIDVFDEELNLVWSVVDGDNWQDNYYDAKDINPASDFLSDKDEGYNNATATKQFIFAVDANAKRDPVDGSVVQRTIKVFDWEGNPICLLDTEWGIFGIAVDEEEGILYGTDMNNEKVLRYDIKNLMEQWTK